MVDGGGGEDDGCRTLATAVRLDKAVERSLPR